MVIEVKHVPKGTGQLVERPVPDLAGTPVLLDEAQHRALIGRRVVDKVGLGEGRDDEQRLSWAIAAATLNSLEGRAIAALARCIQLIPVPRRSAVQDRRRIDDR